MKNTNEFTAKDGTKVNLYMQNDQKNYVAHWLLRHPADLVCDIYAKLKAKGVEVKIDTRKDYENFIVATFNKAYELDLDAKEYDFGGVYDRLNPEPVKEVKADSSDPLGVYIAGMITKLDGVSAEISKGTRTERVKLSDIQAKLVAAKLPEQAVSKVIEAIKNHTAIEKVAPVSLDFTL